MSSQLAPSRRAGGRGLRLFVAKEELSSPGIRFIEHPSSLSLKCAPYNWLMDLRHGDVVAGKYRVEKLLGRGGFGAVFAATDLELDELVAIKLMLDQAGHDADAEQRFLREARAAARLKGEHVVRVLDVSRLEDGAPFIVMEHLDGQTLRAMLRARGRLPW